jgi:hypothetical protein
VLKLALSGIVIGTLFHNKPYAIKLELFRLCAISLFLTATLSTVNAPLSWISLGLTYWVLSGAAMATALWSSRAPLQQATA